MYITRPPTYFHISSIVIYNIAEDIKKQHFNGVFFIRRNHLSHVMDGVLRTYFAPQHAH